MTTLHRDPDLISAQVSVEGRATGTLKGGKLNALTRSIGVDPPNLDGAILLLVDTRVVGIGVVDRALTQLLRSGVLRGVRGVALGQFTGFEDYVDRGWTVVDVLQDRLATLNVPVLGGLPIGPGDAVPVGMATIDTAAGTLTLS